MIVLTGEQLGKGSDESQQTTIKENTEVHLPLSPLLGRLRHRQIGSSHRIFVGQQRRHLPPHRRNQNSSVSTRYRSLNPHHRGHPCVRFLFSWKLAAEQPRRFVVVLGWCFDGIVAPSEAGPVLGLLLTGFSCDSLAAVVAGELFSASPSSAACHWVVLLAWWM